jgi:hypothetical protein
MLSVIGQYTGPVVAEVHAPVLRGSKGRLFSLKIAVEYRLSKQLEKSWATAECQPWLVDGDFILDSRVLRSVCSKSNSMSKSANPSPYGTRDFHESG